MDLTKKPVFSGGLGTAGGALGGLAGAALGADIAGIGVATLAGAVSVGASVGLLELAKHFPEAWPEGLTRNWFKIGERLRFVDMHTARMLNKADADFEQSPLPAWTRVIESRSDILAKVKQFGALANTFGREIDRFEKRAFSPSADAAAFGRPTADCLAKLQHLARPLSISSTILEPAILAALIDMRERLKIPIELNYKSINGVEQMKTVADRFDIGDPFDIVITATAPMLLSGASKGRGAVRRRYSLLMPVHRGGQAVLRPTFKGHENFPDLKGVERVSYLAASSCEEQFLSLRAVLDRKLDERPATLSDLPSLLDDIEPNEAVILYEPTVGRAVRSGRFKISNAYHMWIAIFVEREFSRRHGIDSELMELFTASWTFCKRHRPYARGLLLQDVNVLSSFMRSMFIDRKQPA